MSGLTIEQVERLTRVVYGYPFDDDEREEVRNGIAPVVAALIAEAVEQARAEVAAQIEARYLGADFGRGYDGREGPQAALSHAYDEGLEMAARIARGEVSP